MTRTAGQRKPTKGSFPCAITKIVLPGTLIGAAVADGKGTANAQYYPHRPTVTAVAGKLGTVVRRVTRYRAETAHPMRSRRRRMEYLERLSAGSHRTGRQLRTLSRSNRLPAAPMVWLLNSSGRRLSAYLIGRRLADPSAMPDFAAKISRFSSGGRCGRSSQSWQLQ